jgi:hypothetical protein
MIPAVLLIVACTPLQTCTAVLTTDCATPTPCIAWDQVTDTDLAGYELNRREPGGTWQVERDFPCEWFDTNDPPDGSDDVRLCRGPDLDVPLQRYCPSCAPFNEYEFCVRAYDSTGNRSVDCSNTVTVCFPPLCVPQGPCD